MHIHGGRKWDDLTREQRHEAVKEREEAGYPATRIATEFGVTKGVISGVHNQLKLEGGRGSRGPRAAVRTVKPTTPKPPKKRKASAVLVGGMLMPTPSGGPKPSPNDFKGRAEQRAASPGISKHHAMAFKPIAEPTIIVKVEPVTLMALGGKCCKWPVGGNGAETLFCARAVDGETGVYCRGHKRQSGAPSRSPAPSNMRSTPRLRNQT